MDLGQQHFVIVAVAVLVGLGGWVGWRQLRTLRQLPVVSTEASDDIRLQARRRLVCSALLLLLAVLLAGTLLLGLEERASEMGALHENNPNPPPLNPEQKRFVGLYTTYWSVILLVLLGILITALLDVRAIRRYGARQQWQIQADRQAMIEEQAARYRSERNGNG